MNKLRFKGKERKMFQKEMLSTGEKVDFNRLDFCPPSFITSTEQCCFLYDADTLNFLSVNKPVLDFYNLESEEAFENKDVFFLEKLKREANPDLKFDFGRIFIRDMEHTLSKGSVQLCSAVIGMLDERGFCVVKPTVKVPLFRDKKLKALLSVSLNNTWCTPAEDLYKRYKTVYETDMKKGNRLFMEYLGLLIYDHVLTTREIETLISLAKNRTNINAARELGLSAGTLAAYIHEIKNRLHNQNLNDILLHFTIPDRRKF
jgi:DNA-binding CsgD family transcriptional regulator